MKKNLKIFLFIIILIVFILVIAYSRKNILINISSEDREDLMKLLNINNSSSFLPISINKVDLGFGDTTGCYTLKFEISIEDYNNNKLNYNNSETPEVSLKWKEQKDEKTYICYIREWEYNEYRVDLFNELQELAIKY